MRSSKHTYDVRFEDDFASVLGEHVREGDVVLVDARVKELYSEGLSKFLHPENHLIIEPSEEKKSFQALAPVIERLIEGGFRKNHRLIAIGGGITQDITAFIASILYRGVDWIFYPTTLLAQCDSCIGSKTSINFGKYKNQLGGFHPPREIVIDLGFLRTLAPLDIRSGMGEMLHYHLVSGEDDFRRMLRDYELALTDQSVLGAMVRHSLELKKPLAEKDEFDQGPRNVFNYGHTFGHAIESLTDFRIPHGIAVSFGMDIANFLSVKLGHLPEETRTRVRELLRMNWGDIRPAEIGMEQYADCLLKDKKTIGSTTHVILTRGLGQMFKTPLELNDEVRGWISECFEEFD